MYQSKEGGETYVPLDKVSKIIQKATPRLAKLISSSYTEECSRLVQSNFEEHRCIRLNRSYIQDLSSSVSSIMIDTEGEEEYKHEMLCKERVRLIALSRDGAKIGIKSDGYREAMCGTISLYNFKGERINTI